MDRVLPNCVTNYYVPHRRPFLNLSDLSDAGWEAARATLESERAGGKTSRMFGRRYLELRRATEQKLRSLFVEAGGIPERAAPHYFVLGSSEWFRGLSPGMREVVIPLEDLPEASTSMTIPDSMTAMALGPAFGLPYEARPCHERAFRLSEFKRTVHEFGIPEDGPKEYADHQHRIFEKYIEVLVWSDSILELISPGT